MSTDTLLLTTNHNDETIQHKLDAIMGEVDGAVLVRQLKTLLGLTAEAFVLNAAILRRLKELDYPIPIPANVVRVLELVGNGKLVAEAASRFYHNERLISSIAMLDDDHQRRIANNEPFKVAELGGSHRLVPPDDLTRDDIRQLFDGGRIRAEAEQISWLRDQQRKQVIREAKPIEDDIEIDSASGYAIFHGKHGDRKLSIAELSRIVAELGRSQKRRRRDTSIS